MEMQTKQGRNAQGWSEETRQDGGRGKARVGSGPSHACVSRWPALRTRRWSTVMCVQACQGSWQACYVAAKRACRHAHHGSTHSIKCGCGLVAHGERLGKDTVSHVLALCTKGIEDEHHMDTASRRRNAAMDGPLARPNHAMFDRWSHDDLCHGNTGQCAWSTVQEAAGSCT